MKLAAALFYFVGFYIDLHSRVKHCISRVAPVLELKDRAPSQRFY